MKTVALVFLLLVISTLPAQADTDDRYITIVNPVRLSKYNHDPVESLKAQYAIVLKYNLPATWLFTYDALNNKELSAETKKMVANQEQGVFLEISPFFAKNSGVGYNQSGSWHFARSVFLSGYVQNDRKKLIDTIFEKFKQEFGQYPKSVGAWWIDSFSLDYMQQKYGITANLSCSDQFSTDNYQIWGTYWSVPYYPNKINAAIPANSLDNKIKVVTLQWAAREPKRGYSSSLYSTQDYFTTEEKYNTDYFSRLVDTYLDTSNSFSQITVGLENDFPKETFSGEFENQLKVLLAKKAKFKTMAEFSDWYLHKFPSASPAHQIGDDKFIWYQSPYYRVGIDLATHTIVDLRAYPENFREPYFIWPNPEDNLRVYVPSVIDSFQNQSEIWNYGPAQVKLFPDHFVITGQVKDIPKHVLTSRFLTLSVDKTAVTVNPKKFWPAPTQGLTFIGPSLETKHIMLSPKALFKTILLGKINKINYTTYSVSQDEIAGLEKLRLAPPGKILVNSSECLQCAWYGDNMPAVFANFRKYVANYTHKKIVYSKTLLPETDRSKARDMIKRLGVKYIYLVKYGDYQEKLRFSPGDYGINLIFENSNSQIWEVNSL